MLRIACHFRPRAANFRWYYPSLLALWSIVASLSLPIAAPGQDESRNQSLEDELFIGLLGQRKPGPRGAAQQRVKVTTREILLSPEAARVIPRGRVRVVSVGKWTIDPIANEPESEPEAPPIRSDPVSGKGATEKPAVWAKPLIRMEEVTTSAARTETGNGIEKIPVRPGEKVVKVTAVVDDTARVEGKIQFGRNSVEIVAENPPGYLRSLKKVLNRDAFKDYTFLIEGHASADGPALHNQILSQLRANKVFEYLTRTDDLPGVNPFRLFPIGIGESEAKHSELSREEALQADRRVVVRRLEKPRG